MKLRNILFFLSFIEGGAVMVCELTGAKILAPVFGTSIYVWASILGVTLGALAIGYFLGGLLSLKNNDKRINGLLSVLIVSGIFVLSMPILSKFAFNLTQNKAVETGTIISLLIYMFPPLTLFGMTSPLIIAILTEANFQAGRNSGLVYAISTVGGITFTFITGFYLLPLKGIVYTLNLIGIILILIPVAIFVFKRVYISLLSLVCLVIPLQILRKKENKEYKILYQSEGIYGQVKVLDYWQHFENKKFWTRALMVNNQFQTVYYPEYPNFDFWNYTSFMPQIISTFESKKILLIGLGGGTLVKKLNNMGLNIDVVEIDERIKNAAVQYFGVNSSNNNFYIEDGRRYINTCNKKYDLIIYDIFSGETPPPHLYTKECFEKIKNILEPNGKLLINFFGFIKGENGLASRGLFNTLRSVFPNSKVFVTDLTEVETSRNLLFVSSKNYNDLTFSDVILKNEVTSQYSTGDFGLIFTDNLSFFEKLCYKPSKEWRNYSRSNHIYRLL